MDANTLFFEIHQGLPREGPGSDHSVRWACSVARAHLPTLPVVVEAACGPGGSLPSLRRELPDAHITAFDTHAPFVEDARALALPGVDLLVADMATWSPAEPVDLVWCEGAAYFLGVSNALARFHSWLRPGGVLVFSEAVWRVPEPERPPRAVTFWQEYPAMNDIAHTRGLVDVAGFERLDDTVLPDSDWLEGYYRPMAARLAQLRPLVAGHPEAEGLLDAHDEEIRVFEAASYAYGYLMTVARRRS